MPLCFGCSIGNATAVHAKILESLLASVASLRSCYATASQSRCPALATGDVAYPHKPMLCVFAWRAGSPRREVTRMGNKGDTGPFAPLVRAARNVIGKKEFNKLRGKAISLHSQGGAAGRPVAHSTICC